MNYLILADVHANLPALEAVLDRERDWDAVLFLGDAVDAGPHPGGVLDALSRTEGRFVLGNHDRAVLDADGEFTPGTRDFCQWTSEQLSDRHRDVLADFRKSTRISTGGRTIHLHHGDFAVDPGGSDWNGRLWPDTDRAVYESLARRYDGSTVLFGHSHVQFDVRVDGTRFVNPGSVGQHRLGEVAACYAVLEDGEFRFEACEYDAARTVSALEELPLDDDYLRARKRVYTDGTIPGDMRDFAPLRERGYR